MEFQHLDPVKGKLPFFRLVREFGKSIRAVYPLYRLTEIPSRSPYPTDRVRISSLDYYVSLNAISATATVDSISASV
jgi:hypothetical protein